MSDKLCCHLQCKCIKCLTICAAVLLLATVERCLTCLCTCQWATQQQHCVHRCMDLRQTLFHLQHNKSSRQKVLFYFFPLSFHKMTQSTPFTVLVAALLINTLSYCSTENVYCVTPTATSCSSCPKITHCATLSKYAQEAKLYFTSNTTMVFLPGNHVLDRNISVDNVTRLTMHGESSSDNMATIVHNGYVGFSFTNMEDFKICSLAFTSYNKSWSYSSHPASNSALLLRSTKMLNWLTVPFMTTLVLHLQYTTLTLLWQGTMSSFITIVHVSHSVRGVT